MVQILKCMKNDLGNSDSHGPLLERTLGALRDCQETTGFFNASDIF